MGFLKGVFDKRKGFLRVGMQALDRVNRATAEGKALDQLHERLIGLPIEAELRLKDAFSMPDHREDEVVVWVATSEPISPELRIHIQLMLAALDRRFGANIRAEFVNRPKQNSGQ